MEYVDMTKEQLMHELVKMRQRISIFEQTEKDLKESEERFRIQFRSMPTPTFIWRISGDKRILADINDAAVNFTKGEVDHLINLIGVEASRFYRDMPDYLNDMNRCLAEKITVINEYPYSLRTTGEKKHVFVKHVFVEPDTVMAHVEDMTLQKQEQEHLKYISVHDSLTGLYNRLYADTEVDRLRDSRRYPISVIVFDVDGLKTVNDSEGHAAGDQLILDTADVLRKSFRPEDMVARTGGDEFLVVLPFVDEVTLEGVLARFQKSLERCNAASNRPLSISFGTATAVSGEMLNDSIRQADMFMYQHKAQKKVARR